MAGNAALRSAQGWRGRLACAHRTTIACGARATSRKTCPSRSTRSRRGHARFHPAIATRPGPACARPTTSASERPATFEPMSRFAPSKRSGESASAPSKGATDHRESAAGACRTTTGGTPSVTLSMSPRVLARIPPQAWRRRGGRIPSGRAVSTRWVMSISYSGARGTLSTGSYGRRRTDPCFPARTSITATVTGRTTDSRTSRSGIPASLADSGLRTR